MSFETDALIVFLVIHLCSSYVNQFKPMPKVENVHLIFREDQGLASTGIHRFDDETGLGERHLLQGELGEEIPKGSHQRWTV